MDASHRDGDGSIHLSFIPHHAGSSAYGRSLSEIIRGVFPAPADILDAFSDLLSYRAEGSQAASMALVAAADPGWPVWRAGIGYLARYEIVT